MESIMKTTDRSAVRAVKTRSRLWVLAVVGILFSVCWPVLDAFTRTHQNISSEPVAQAPVFERNMANRDRLRLMPAVTTKGIHHARSSLAVPVGFHVADLNIPRNSDRVFSYRKIDEFLQHQVRLTDGARHHETNERGMDVDEQGADRQIF